MPKKLDKIQDASDTMERSAPQHKVLCVACSVVKDTSWHYQRLIGRVPTPFAVSLFVCLRADHRLTRLFLLICCVACSERH